MASTWSALKIELLETGQNSGTWGTSTNVNLGDAVLGEAITGQATVDFASDADVTITLTDSATTQAARNLRLNITESSTGIGSVRNLILGSGCQIEKFYLINNTGTGAKTIKNTSGTGITVPAGKATLVYNNGTNVVDAASYFTSLTLGSALPVASGGTGLTAGTSGGILGYTATGTLASSVALTANALVLGAGAGATPTPMASLGTTTTVLHGNASGAPTFGAVSLTADVSGVLPTANGGTNLGGATPFTSGGVVYASSSSALATGSALTFDGTQVKLTGNPPTINFNSVTSNSARGLLFENSGTQFARLTANFQTGDFRFLSGETGQGGYFFTWYTEGSEKMRLDASGNLGIGTSSPTTFSGYTVLEVKGPSEGGRITANYNNSIYMTMFANSNGLGYVGTNSAHPAVFITSGTERMRITDAGSVGIGTSSPVARLDVATSSGAANSINTHIALTRGTSNGAYFSTERAAASNDVLALGFGVNSAERMRIMADGSVGIGTSTPNNNLEVLSSSNPSIAVNSTTSSLYCYFGMTAGTVGGTLFTFGQSYSAVNPAGSTVLTNNTYGIILNATNASGILRFQTADTERMRISSAGNVGIGTSSPAAKLEIKTDSNEKFILNSTLDTNSYQNQISFQNAGTQYAAIVAGKDGSNLSLGLVFKTGNTERARITSGGYFKASNSGNYVGATSNYHELVTDDANTTLYVANTNASPNGVVVSYRTADPNGTGNQFIYCEGNAATQRMSVRSNGGIANYSANDVNLSDRREKTNFAPAASYLDKICAIPVQTFNYIDQNMEDDDGLTLGVIAQDVQAVAPELVMESNWASKDAEPKMRLSIYQTDLQYALMKCIQEQQAIIESLKARLDAANL